MLTAWHAGCVPKLHKCHGLHAMVLRLPPTPAHLTPSFPSFQGKGFAFFFPALPAVNSLPTEEMKRVLGEKIGLTEQQVSVSAAHKSHSHSNPWPFHLFNMHGNHWAQQ